MPNYQTPGVYVEEVSSGSKPIEAGATNIAGFLGVAEKGPVNEAVLVTNWTQYTKIFGGLHSKGWLGHGVYQFFQNGGTKAYINNLMELPQEKKKPAAKGEEGADQKADAAEAPQEPVKIENPANIAKLIIGTDDGPGKKTGLCLFDTIPDIALVAAPGVIDPAAQDAILTHCEKNRFRFAVLDSPEELEKGIDTMPMPRDSIMGAYYFPWIEMYDTAADQNVYAPPSGGMCGICSRVDGTRGVHKAPANEIFKTALGLKYNLTDAEQELLNPKGINCIREFPGRGIRVWGARTVSSDPEWRYVNVRRLFCMVEQAIQNGTNWVVFEPNTRDLWKKITRNITSFLLNIWRSGALFGDTPEEAFYVRCDDELNPPESIDAGYVVVELGLAPAKPAEFVVFRVSQKTLDNE
ncbi:phage tail sheath family protein [Breznakiella homolactica]|uniref:Phage tail sheath family protein n=1 Tax=Breznakiella homolactica TaxID=2798577 RepID=A0A7T8BA55_9SPIR|nr:phage tail sheath C-terminal domain-containing protein [Breznakiella homolactica]QQO09006.1 phage tail sheath subtilisin-like domain-containing protein [Breznakiella homolactica]